MEQRIIVEYYTIKISEIRINRNMIKDIHEFLTESIDHSLSLSTKPYNEQKFLNFILFVNDLNKTLEHSLAQKLHRDKDDDINISNRVDRDTTTSKNLLIYVVIKDIDTAKQREETVKLLRNIIADHVDGKTLTNLKTVRKTSYSGTVDVIEVVYTDDKVQVKLNYVVKCTAALLAVNNVRNSDITEIMPVLLFYMQHKAKPESIPNEVNNDTIADLRRNLAMLLTEPNQDLIPAGYHEARINTLFYNVEHDDAAKNKIKAGINLYKFLNEHFENKIAKISVVANMVGYDTVADINCTLKDNTVVPVSIKSYSSMANAIKIKSLTWHRLILNTIGDERPALRDHFEDGMIIDGRDEIQASHNLLQQLAINLTTEHHTTYSRYSTLDILCIGIRSKQHNTIVVDAVTKSDDIVHHKELTYKTIQASTFIPEACRLDGNTLKVKFNNLEFSIVVRYKSRTSPTFDIYYNYKK